MKKLIVLLCVLALASIASADIIGVTQTGSSYAAIGIDNSTAGGVAAKVAAPEHALDDVAINNAMQGFNEVQNFITTKDHAVDGPGVILKGTLVSSHMIFLNSAVGQTLRHGAVVWEFDGIILGVMSDRGGVLENNGVSGVTTVSELDNPGTNYTVAVSPDRARPFGARGLEGANGHATTYADGYEIIAPNKIRVSMSVSQPGDWMRVVTTPAPGAFLLGGLGLSFAAGKLRRRKSA